MFTGLRRRWRTTGTAKRSRWRVEIYRTLFFPSKRLAFLKTSWKFSSKTSLQTFIYLIFGVSYHQGHEKNLSFLYIITTYCLSPCLLLCSPHPYVKRKFSFEFIVECIVFIVESKVSRSRPQFRHKAGLLLSLVETWLALLQLAQAKLSR